MAFTLIDDAAPQRKGKFTLVDEAPPIAGGVNPTGSFGENLAAGAGKFMTDMARGAGQRLGVVSEQDAAEARRLDAPLMGTAGGKLGAVGGALAAAVPAMLVPGAGTYTGAAALGGAMGALQPTVEGESAALNTAAGAGLGPVAKGVTDKLGQALASRLAQSKAAAAGQQAQNAVRDATLAEAQAAGYVIPKSAVNPSIINNRLESIAGKAALGQEATLRNQEVTNTLARKALGLADDTPLTEGTLNQVRREAGKAYAEVAKLSPRADVALARLKDARNQSKLHWTHYGRSADPNALRTAQHFDQLADQLEAVIEKVATKANKPELIDELRAARVQIAKSYEIEKALNLGSGNVSAPSIGRSLDKGSPMKGELATIGKFQQAFRPYARETEGLQGPGVSKVEALAAGMFGLGGHAAAGPAGALFGALPLMSTPVRNMLLSGAYQRAMVHPNYSTNALLRLAAPVANNSLVRRGAVPLSAYIGLDGMEQ